MTDHLSSSDDSRTRVPDNFWVESAQSANTWAAVAAAFLAVVALCWLVVFATPARSAGSERPQSTQNAARFAQQLELDVAPAKSVE